MGRLKLNLGSHLWLHKPTDRPGESKIEVAEVEAKANQELSTVDKFWGSPLNNRSFDIAYPSKKNCEQVKSRATRRAEVVSDVGCSCRRSFRYLRRLHTEEQQRVPDNKSRVCENKNTEGKGIVYHEKPISSGNKSKSSPAGFEPGTCTALDNKNHSIDSAACSRGDDEKENEIEIDVVFCDLLARKCEECACSDDVEGNSLISSCSVHGKAGQSSAVVKRSEDPYSDFRCSMVHMILEKNIYEPSELRGLLECFLCLNSPEHHGIIMEAFTEICVNISSVLSEGI